LVLPDKDGKPYTVRYDAVNAMLLNEFLKEHRKVQDLEATVAQQQKSFESKLAEQESEIKALTYGLQKVNAQLAAASPSTDALEVNKPAPKVATNNQ
jgi:septal ring factor EnvC (AmiA/AmiB activator)